MADAMPKVVLFARLGYGGSHDLLEQALEDAGLSRPAKAAIAAAKEDAVAAPLAERFVAVCSRGDCQAEAKHREGEDRTIVPAASQATCEICGGSANAHAVDGMVAALLRAGMSRLCVVGGSPVTRTTLDGLVAGRIELRLVDGTASRTTAQARADVAWADRVAIWGATLLDHRVSGLYHGTNVIQLAKRGIRELAREVGVSIDG